MNSYKRLKNKLESQREEFLKDIDKIINHPDDRETVVLIRRYRMLILLEDYKPPIGYEEMVKRYGGGFSDIKFLKLLKEGKKPTRDEKEDRNKV